jgi:hypothetical protein
MAAVAIARTTLPGQRETKERGDDPDGPMFPLRALREQEIAAKRQEGRHEHHA